MARHYWPKPGAATVRLQAMVDAFVDAGAAVTVLTTRVPGLEQPTVGPRGETVVPVPGDDETGVGLRRVVLLVVFAVCAWIRLLRLRPTIVVSDPPPTSGLAALACGADVTVYYVADLWSEMLRVGDGSVARILARFVAPLERWVLRRARRVIVVRRNLGEYAAAAGAKDLVVAPYGTDVSAFSPVGETWPDPWAGELPYFLYAGNYGVVQGGTVFLDAARELWSRGMRFGLVYMGYGADAEAVAACAREFPDRMVTLPLQPAELAAAAYRGAVGGLASMRPEEVAGETRPAKALASIAAGCPIIFAGVGTFCAEVVDHGLGLAPDWSAEVVAEAMADLLETARVDPAAYSRMRRVCSTYAAQHLDIRVSARQLVEGILEVANA